MGPELLISGITLALYVALVVRRGPISILLILTVAGSALTTFATVTHAQPIAPKFDGNVIDADERTIERIVHDGTPLHGFLTRVEVELKRCVLTRVETFSRRCGTSFDSSSALSRTQIIDFSKYSNPNYSAQTNIISFIYNDGAGGRNDRRSSFTAMNFCSGKTVREEGATFLLTSKRDDPDPRLQKNYEILAGYITRNCR